MRKEHEFWDQTLASQAKSPRISQVISLRTGLHKAPQPSQVLTGGIVPHDSEFDLLSAAINNPA